MQDRSVKKICILGGGFAGLYTALSLQKYRGFKDKNYQIILIDRHDHILFTPLLYEVVTDELKTWEIAPSFKKLIKDTSIDFYQDNVENIDLNSRQVLLQERGAITYDYLVLAVGREAYLDEVPGVREHTLGFRTLADTYKLKQRLNALEASDRDRIRVAVVGGGPSGVELATKIADRLGKRGEIRLITRSDRILKDFTPQTRKSALKALEKRNNGDAVYYAVHFDPYATPVGQILATFPEPLLKLITYATLVLEGIGPLFLFVPVYTAFFRGATVISFIFLHVIFGLCFIIGVFPLLSSASWLAFIPTAFWDNLEKRLDVPQRTGLTIYYDKECGFCKKVVYLLRTFLVLPRTTLLAAQEREDASIYADMQAHNSWVVVDWQGNRRFKWDAMCYVVSLSPVFKPLASILRFPPLFSVGTKFYEIIARNRRTAGIFTKPLKFRPMVVRPSLILNIIALLLILATFFWNIRTFAQRTYERRTVRQNDWISFTYHLFNRRTIQSVDWVSRLTRLDQGWSIFAPAPPKDDGWHVIPGKLKDGSEVDVLRGLEKPVSWEKPTMQERNALYGDMHWRTFFIALNRAIGKKLYPTYARYLCREWNSKHQGNKKLESFEIFFMNERTVPPGEKQTVEKESHWKQDCQ